MILKVVPYKTGMNTIEQINNKIVKNFYAFNPTVYKSSLLKTDESILKTVNNEIVDEYKFGNIWEYYQYTKVNKHLHGNIAPTYQFLRENSSILNKKIETPLVWMFDIEVPKKTGFPDAETALSEITAITFANKPLNRMITFGIGKYNTESERVKKIRNDMYFEYIDCADEEHLLSNMLDFFKEQSVYLLSGWNIDAFDTPYIVNRLKYHVQNSNNYVFEDWINDNVDRQRGTDVSFKTITTFDLMNIYKKFKKKLSYSLENVCNDELGEAKIQKTFGFWEMYDEHYNMFIDYNIIDVYLLLELEEKLKYLKGTFETAKMFKILPEDYDSAIRAWDAKIYDELLKEKIVVPPVTHNSRKPLLGGFVGNIKPKKVNNEFVIDITSSYPHQIMQYNISPETHIPLHKASQELIRFVSKYKQLEPFDRIQALIEMNVENKKKLAILLKKYQYTMTPNFEFFDATKEGIFPRIVKKVFDERVFWKRRAQTFDAIIHKIGKVKSNGTINKFDETTFEKDTDFSIYDNKTLKLIKKRLPAWYDNANVIQNNLKIKINSLYGILANIYFRFYKHEVAEAITAAGQISVRGLGNYLERTLNSLKVHYYDTDSVFMEYLDMPKNIKNYEERINIIETYYNDIVSPKIKEYNDKLAFLLNCPNGTKINMELENIFDQIIHLAPKKYIGRKIYQDGTHINPNDYEFKLRGIEIVRRSTPKFIAKCLTKSLEFVFNEERDNTHLLKLINKMNGMYNKLKLHEIGTPISYNANDYTFLGKGSPRQVNAALNYNKVIKDLDLNIEPNHSGNKVKIFELKEKVNGFPAIAFPLDLENYAKEITSKIRVDKELMWEKQFINPLKRITDVIQWSTKETLDFL